MDNSKKNPLLPEEDHMAWYDDDVCVPFGVLGSYAEDSLLIFSINREQADYEPVSPFL